ncbi:MAG: hypothetical protein BroJett011_47080 [Chloroflexota bacterium]|nr:MAG: hypothetical protein BroJett011_47080 [Chloroflexota bacterium]
MNTQQIQFDRQRVVSLLFAGLIFTLAAGLAWTGADASGSALQPAQTVQACVYSPQPDQTEPSAAEVVCAGADFSERENGLPSWSHLKSIKGGKGGVNGGDVHK